MAKMMIVQTKFQGVWGQTVRCPGGEYQCSEGGEMEVSEEDARALCQSSGWRLKPQEQAPTPVRVPQRQPMPTRSPVSAKAAVAEKAKQLESPPADPEAAPAPSPSAKGEDEKAPDPKPEE